MNTVRTTSRLQRIEEKKNRQQAFLFILLTIGFLLILIFAGFPLFVKTAIFIGDIRSSGQAIETKDTTPPVPPKLLVAIEATNSATINISGYTEPGASVQLVKNNDKSAEEVADPDGNFTFKDIKLMGGENSLHAVAVDTTGNQSQPSTAVKIVYDNKAPQLSVTAPKNGDEYFDDDREIVISGTTEPGVDVHVNEYVVVVDNEGNFVKRLLLLEGENEITITATDVAGNQAKETLTVKYIH